jgi:hypothetical protein
MINDLLGDDLTPSDCLGVLHPEDPFTQGKDETHHRQSWLWPKFARRVTKNRDGSFHESHVMSNSREAKVTAEECNSVFESLKAKMGPDAAMAKMPKACKK